MIDIIHAKMQEFPGSKIRQSFILEQIDNLNRLCETMRTRFRLVDKFQS